MKTLIVCASRYGSTLEIGRWIAERLPWPEVVVASVENAPSPDENDLIFLGGGVYNEKVDNAIVQYAETHTEALKEKRVVAYAACLDTRGVYMKGKFFGGWLYLEPLLQSLDADCLVHAAALSGEINPSKLTRKDHDLLMYFYTKILKRDMTEVPYRTLMSKAEVWEFVEKVMARLEGRF